MLIHIRTHDEEWKVITYPGVKADMYEISSYGRVRNIKRNKILKNPKPNKCGYVRIALQTGNPDMPENLFSIHRLVAYQFIPNPDNKPDVNHIIPGYEGKSINDAEYLEWCTKSENIQYAIKTKRHWSYIGGSHQCALYSDACRCAVIDMCLSGHDNGDIIKMIRNDFPEYADISDKKIRAFITKMRSRDMVSYKRGIMEGSTTIQLPR